MTDSMDTSATTDHPFSPGTRKAVVLAGGMGTRMRLESDQAPLDPAARAAASAGLKGMIPLRGRPFLDYVLQGLWDAGFRELCLIVPPVRSPLHDYYERMGQQLRGGTLQLAVQAQPRGTADAVLAGESFVGNDNFIVLNSDNLYPPSALADLRLSPAPGAVAFDSVGLTRGNIPAQRVAAFAVMDIDDSRHLRRIVEKPADPRIYASGGHVWVSMNCWHFTPAIFHACRSIQPDPVRNELEIPTAVQFAIERMGLSFAVTPCDQPVLDLTRPADIASVAELLADVNISLPEVKP